MAVNRVDVTPRDPRRSSFNLNKVTHVTRSAPGRVSINCTPAATLVLFDLLAVDLACLAG